MRPRFHKVLRDLGADRGKNLMLVLALAVGLLGIGAILGAYAVMTRTMRGNYLGSVPASATIQVDGEVTRQDVAMAVASPGVARADRRATLLGRVQVAGTWKPILLFVVDDFARMQVSQVRPVAGAWPPPTGTVLVERTALPELETALGERLLVRTPHGPPAHVTVSGVVHDPGLAPAWQEKMGYAYLTLATLAQLGETQGFDELRVLVADESASFAAIEAAAQRVATSLAGRGHVVHEIQIPRPRSHPHQGQMNAVLTMLILFSGLTLVLGAIVVASSIGALMARQIRQIGVMKAIGAGSRAIAGLYFAMVGVLAGLALLLAVPASRLASSLLVGRMAQLLNLDVVDGRVPPWVLGLQIAVGFAVPLAVTALPILRGSRVSVRQALDDHGVPAGFGRSRLDRLVLRLPGLAWRNVFRRRARLVLTVALLAAGGAMFMSALNLSRMWDVRLRDMFAFRRDDVELRLAEGVQVDEQRLAREAGVEIERWRSEAVTFHASDGYPVVRTYPDKGHGSASIVGLPLDTRMLLPLPLAAGRWLREGENEVVLNASARAQAPHARLGEPLHIGIDGRDTVWRVVGFVDNLATPSATAFVSRAALERAFPGARTVLHVAGPAGTLEERLEGQGVRVDHTLRVAVLRGAVADHMKVLVAILIALAVLMAVVGTLGLASTVSVNLFERTRELGVLRAIGATPGRILRQVLAEGWIMAVLSLGFALVLSWPLSAAVGRLIGQMAFRTPLSLAVSAGGVGLWILLVALGSTLATWIPARRAARLSPREALAYE